MTLWNILVCGVIRLDLNMDYDRLHEMVNKHSDIRAMLGHSVVGDVKYLLQTLKDNVGLLTPACSTISTSWSCSLAVDW